MWRELTQSLGWRGFASNSRICEIKLAKHRANSSKEKVINYGDGVDFCPSLDHKQITLTVRPGSSAAKRAAVVHEWHKSILHEAVPVLIKKWESKLGVKVSAYFLQRMKTKWGSCSPAAGHIRLNTELVKKPKDLLEYVVVHEMVHLIEPVHSERFMQILHDHYPTWREARMELNELPLSAEAWRG